MFHSVSWQQYIIFILVLLFVYYVYILLRYYRNELSHLLKGVKKLPAILEENGNNKTLSPGNAKLNELLEELKNLFQLASQRKYPKEELMMALQLKLREYDQFKNTPFEIAVNNFIAEESENQCSIHLGVEDQRVLWMG